MARKKLKLYVWENVFCDHTSGAAWALAYDADHARELIVKANAESNATLTRAKLGAEKAMRRIAEIADSYAKSTRKELAGEPLEVTEPTGFCVWGGG